MTLGEMVDQEVTQELNTVRFHQTMVNRDDDFTIPLGELRHPTDVYRTFTISDDWITPTADVPTLPGITAAGISRGGRIIMEPEVREMINDLKTELKEEMDLLKKEIIEFKEELRFLREV